MKKSLLLIVALAVLLAISFWYVRASHTAPVVTFQEQSVGLNQYLSHAEDINGDGRLELIQVSILQNPIEGSETILTIAPHWRVVVPGRNPEGWFGIVDLDTSDKKKEIAVSDLGPSGDPTTAFYDFDGTNIYALGTTQGTYENMIVDGKGGFTTTTRAQILETWFYKDEFRLKNGKIVHVPKDFYEHIPTGLEPIKMQRDFSLQASPSDTTTSVVLKKGDTVTILGCDNVKWCQLEAGDGARGWFSVSDFGTIDGLNVSAGDVFDGLSMAD